MVNLDDFSPGFYLGVAFKIFYLKEGRFGTFILISPMLIFLGILGRFIFFTADTAWAGAPAKPASDFSSLFCASVCVTISSCWSPIPFPPSPFLQEYCEHCLHGKLNPVHRRFQNTCLMFPQILELHLKCQVHFLKNPPRRQNIMLHNVYKSVCCQILQLIILLLGNYVFISLRYQMECLPDDLLLCIFTVGLVELGEPWLPMVVKAEDRLHHG